MKPGIWLWGIVVIAAFGAIATTSLRAPVFDRGVAPEGWTVERFDAQITINRDASIDIAETVELDFLGLYRHGIIRAIPVEYEHDRTHLRTYDLDVRSVTDSAGNAVPFSVSRAGADLEIKIGDADRFVSGRPQRVRRAR
jgi:hypothetical protein